MQMIHQPIVSWPGKLTAQRKPSPFRTGYTDTLGLLDRELSMLGAKNVVLQVALSRDDIRLDGAPRSGARPSHPGVILTFDSRHGPLSYPCDTFTSWEANLRAIALSLEHLRAVDRYGVTKRGEQYQGWAALPAPVNNGEPKTPDKAVRCIRKHTPSVPPINKETWRDAYRAACLHTHPDRGGDAVEFQRVQAAQAILEKVWP